MNLQRVHWLMLGTGQENVAATLHHFRFTLRITWLRWSTKIKGQKSKSQKDKPKWMTDRPRHYIRQKRSTHHRLKAGEEDLRPQYNELGRTVKRLSRKAKNSYDIEIASQAKTDPKGFCLGLQD